MEYITVLENAILSDELYLPPTDNKEEHVKAEIRNILDEFSGLMNEMEVALSESKTVMDKMGIASDDKFATKDIDDFFSPGLHPPNKAEKKITIRKQGNDGTQ